MLSEPNLYINICKSITSLINQTFESYPCFLSLALTFQFSEHESKSNKTNKRQ